MKKRNRKLSGIKAAARSTPSSFMLLADCSPFELTAGADGSPKLPRTNILAYTGGQMNLDGFYRPVVIDLSGVSVPSQSIPLLRDHDPQRIVGHSEAVEVSAQRIKLGGIVSGTGQDATEITGMAGNGFPWRASVGMSVEAREFVEAGQIVKVNGKNFPGPIIVARKTTLREVSFVALGADVNSAASVAAKSKECSAMTFEQWVQAKSFDAATLTAEQTAALKAMYEAEQAKPPAPPSAPAQQPPAAQPIQATSRTMDEIQAAGELEANRQRAIETMIWEKVNVKPGLAAVLAPIGKQAIEAKWTVEQTRQNIELAEYKNGFPGAPAIISAREPQLTEEVIEAAVCMNGKLQNIEKQFDPKVLEAAHKQWRHGLGLEELVVTAARRNGYGGVNLKNTKSALQAAFQEPEIRAGMGGPSTYTLPNILSNVANKFMAVGFNAVDQAWRQIAAINPVNDFKTKTSISLTTGALIYDKVARGGELKHGSVGELTYTNAADTYGRTIGIDRRDLINDDLGALTGTSRGLGRGAGLKLNDLFWTTFLNNTGSFFTSGHANISTGVFSLTNLAAVDVVFRNQTDSDGMPIGINPSILLVPTALRIAALTAMNSTLVVSTTTANAPLGGGNVLAGAYNVVSSPYMSNSAYTGYSAVAYYLLANPADMPVIEVVFLNGVETPTVESAEADFNTLGIALRAWMDAGVSLQEYRAGVRSTGA